ncbi:MAG: YifB family Mg chelatase-like AAA ATPase [bacterium]|nr:YifB family Mg chelatase-like AAA ATPase [bacterium]MCM1374218.1 YifB family Mg chelatase-like AAA ATPase [Muribaculum sp.]
MYSSILTGSLYGIEANLIHVEVDISTGLPGFSMVGSLSNEVREARERVQVALKNADFDIPPKKITINLAPANLKKDGTGFDVPIAIGILQTLGYFREQSTENILFVGELGLDGEIKPISGILPIVKEAAQRGIGTCIVPWDNRREGGVIPGIQVRGVRSLHQLTAFLQEEDKARREELLPVQPCIARELLENSLEDMEGDFAEIRGQEVARRAAEIAAAGFHNLLMSGPPGGGKSMIARAMAGILPPMTWQESIEVTAIYSVAGMLDSENPLILRRPFQSPHHTVSGAALIGGGAHIHPGAISLAHRGVLFLDELTEFPRSILECLRQPLEDHQVNIARAQGNYIYPADFMLVCAMNPCRCGFFPDSNKCRCSEGELAKYWNRLSGPLLDRMDMYVETSRIELEKLQSGQKGESSAQIRQRVVEARAIQEERFHGKKYSFNGDMEARELEKYCELGREEQRLMELAYRRLGLSARTYHRVLKVARTIADLAHSQWIREEHLSEALAYRMTEGAYKRHG